MMVVYKLEDGEFIRLGNPSCLKLPDGRVIAKSKHAEWNSMQVRFHWHFVKTDDPEINHLIEKHGPIVEVGELGFVARSVLKKSVSECAADACGRACCSYTQSVAEGYDTGLGFTMDTNRHDYQMMREGLAALLSLPDHAAEVDIVDKSDQPHSVTIDSALAISDGMLGNFWTIWKQKTEARAQVKNILSDSELTDSQKIERLVAL